MLQDLDVLWKEFLSALGYKKVMWNVVSCSEGIDAGTDMYALLDLCARMKHKICVQASILPFKSFASLNKHELSPFL